MNIKRPSQGASRDNYENDAETSLTGLGTSMVKNIGQSFGDIGSGIFDGLTGALPNYEDDFNREGQGQKTPEAQQPRRQEMFRVYDHRKIEEDRQINEVKQLIQAIKDEVKMLKQSSESMSQEVSDVQNIIINEKGNKSDIYTIRFLEVVLNLLRSIRMKVGESRTWMDALTSKKAKRGSLFAARSKKQGTQYSQSEEMKVTRNTQ